MKYRYLYIDDENDETTTAIADGLKINELLEIDLAEPKQFREQKTFFEEHLNEYDGIILDLRLDGRRLDIPYNAPALAQEIRMMAVDGKIKSTPIILCSTEEKMRATYNVDKTSHDLFDYKFHKQTSPPWKKFAIKISSLAKGYPFIQSNGFDFKKILGREDLEVFDVGIFERFANLTRPHPISEYAAFVVKELFHHPGLLIKEKLLAARLGVDIEMSGNAWINLRDNFLSGAKYTGVFADGWERWWSDKMVNLFKERSGKRLSILNAVERVKTLSELTGISGLISAEPLANGKSKNYWTICEYFKKPLDPLEGFKIHTSIEPKSWQENKYISLDAVLLKKGPSPHSSELNRITLIKESKKR